MNKENFYEWVNKSDYVSDDVKDYYQKENKLYQHLLEDYRETDGTTEEEV